jgi:Fe-S-cluster containining protein
VAPPFHAGGGMTHGAADKNAPVTCATCDALCCQLTVVLTEKDAVPAHLTVRLPSGLHVMDKDEDGWCVALDGQQMNCRIYDSRPAICRSFVMGGPYCRAERAAQARSNTRGIALQLA